MATDTEKGLIKKQTLQDIADAIRAKGGTTTTMTPSEFATNYAYAVVKSIKPVTNGKTFSVSTTQPKNAQITPHPQSLVDTNGCPVFDVNPEYTPSKGYLNNIAKVQTVTNDDGSITYAISGPDATLASSLTGWQLNYAKYSMEDGSTHIYTDEAMTTEADNWFDNQLALSGTKTKRLLESIQSDSSQMVYELHPLIYSTDTQTSTLDCSFYINDPSFTTEGNTLNIQPQPDMDKLKSWLTDTSSTSPGIINLQVSCPFVHSEGAILDCWVAWVSYKPDPTETKTLWTCTYYTYIDIGYSKGLQALNIVFYNPDNEEMQTPLSYVQMISIDNLVVRNAEDVGQDVQMALDQTTMDADTLKGCISNFYAPQAVLDKYKAFPNLSKLVTNWIPLEGSKYEDPTAILTATE